MKRLKQYLYSPSSLSLADQAIVSGGNFLVTILLARWLSTGEFGSFAVIWLILMFASAIQQALVVAPMMTLFSKSESPQAFISNSLVQIVLYIAIVATFVWITLHFFGSFFWATNYTSVPVHALPLLFTGFLIYDFSRKLLLVRQWYLKAIIMDGLALLVVLSGVSALYISGFFNLQNFVVLYSFTQLSLAIGFLFQHNFTGISAKSLKDQIQQHWQYSRWLVVTSVLQLFAGNFYIITAAALLGPVAMAAIKVVQNIMGLINVLFLAMENYVPVKAAHIFNNEGKQKLFQYLKNNTWQQAIPLVLILSVILLGAESILQLIYGQEFMQYANILRLFTGLYLVNYIGIPFRFAIRTLHRNGWILIAYAVSVVSSLAFAHYFISWWGLAGVAIGMIISQLTLNFTLMSSFLPKIKLKWISYTWS